MDLNHVNALPPRENKEHAPECPICGKNFKLGTSNEEINRHVDECLNGPQIESALNGSPPVQPKRPANTKEEPWTEWFDLTKMEWYYGSIDRHEAERILNRCTSDSFVVRKSSVANSFALSLYNHKKQSVTHTLIEPRDGGYAFQDTPRVYKTILDLITKSPECGGLKPPPKVGVPLDF